MTDPTKDAARRLVERGALHTYDCAINADDHGPAIGECRCEPDVFEVLTALAREVRRQALEEAAAKVEASYPCTCGEAYTGRGLIAPDCWKCNPLAEAVEEVRALSGPSKRTEEKTK